MDNHNQMNKHNCALARLKRKEILIDKRSGYYTTVVASSPSQI